MSDENQYVVHPDEILVRLLFTTRMVDTDGTLGKEAFPVDELIEKSGKSVSVDQESQLVIPDQIAQKLETYQNPDRGREKWGYACALCNDITNIRSQDDQQVYAVFQDPIETNFPPAPWDQAHAKIVRADPSFGKSFIRGYRDILTELFQQSAAKVA